MDANRLTRRWREPGSGSGDFSWDGTTSTAQTSTLGWTIADQASISSDGGTTWQAVSFGPPNESTQFAVNVAGVPEPTGLALGAFVLGNLLVARFAVKRRGRNPATACGH